MATKAAAAAFVIGALVITLGFFFTPMIDATYTDTTTATELSSGERDTLHQNLDVATENINTDNDTINVAVINSRTLERNTTGSLSEDESALLTVGDDQVNVTHSAWLGTSAIVSVDYSNTFGMDSGPALFFGNFGMMLAIVGFLLVVMVLLLAVRGGA